jgi:hypothetical protein
MLYQSSLKKNISIAILIMIVSIFYYHSLSQVSSDKVIEKVRGLYGSEKLFVSKYSEKHKLFTTSVKVIMYNNKEVVEYEESRILGIIPIASKSSTLPKNR